MKTLTRRSFLSHSACVFGAAAGPFVIPASALGRDGATAPSERIVLGAIGIGPRGRYVLGCMLDEADVQFVAICDVRADRRDSVKAMADAKYGNRDCAQYRDLREFLAARDDIDAVLIATGDRWHALASILAMKAGKDVYTEKPCALTMGECGALATVANRYGRVFQAGTQRRSIGNFQFASHLARSGKLGRIHTVHASTYQLSVDTGWLPAQPEPPRDVVDWDLWLGPCPWRPFNQRYIDGGWRGYHDFNAGACLLDWGTHTLDICQMALGTDGTTPVVYEPRGAEVHCQYASGVRLVIRPDGWMGLGTCPVRFEGDEGWVETGDRGDVELFPESLRDERRVFAEVGTSAEGHARNFFDCVKSRALTRTNADVMRSSHVACHAAAIAWQLGRRLAFDPVREEFIADDEANRMRSRAMRAPWTL